MANIYSISTIINYRYTTFISKLSFEKSLIVEWNTLQSFQNEHVGMIGYSLDNSRWADSNLTYRIM